jgi:cell division ATPase FtsA
MKNINRSLNDLGIENLGFIFSGLSFGRSGWLTETEKELGVVLVDHRRWKDRSLHLC